MNLCVRRAAMCIDAQLIAGAIFVLFFLPGQSASYLVDVVVVVNEDMTFFA